MELKDVLEIVGLMLSVGFLIVQVKIFMKFTKTAGAVQAVICLLATAVNYVLDKPLLVGLFGAMMVLNMIYLALGSNKDN